MICNTCNGEGLISQTEVCAMCKGFGKIGEVTPEVVVAPVEVAPEVVETPTETVPDGMIVVDNAFVSPEEIAPEVEVTPEVVAPEVAPEEVPVV